MKNFKSINIVEQQRLKYLSSQNYIYQEFILKPMQSSFKGSHTKGNQEKSNRGQKTQYQEKPTKKRYEQRKKPKLAGSTSYLCLTNDELIYLGNFDIFLTLEFQKVLKKITEDLNILLHLEYEDFWEQIKGTSPPLKCLESCLKIFPRKKFNRHIIKNQNIDLSKIVNNEHFKEWSRLLKVVLFIFHRMICDSRQNQKDYIYDNWLCDIPKLLDLMDIYGDTSPKIIQQIIQQLFKSLPSYRDDVNDFLNILDQSIRDKIFSQIQFQFKSSTIKKAKNFNNALNSFIQNLIKSLFCLYDVFHCLNNYLKFFPQSSRWALISDQVIICDLFDCYMLYLDKIHGGWEIQPYLREHINPILQQIRITMIKFLSESFIQLRDLVKKYIPSQIWVNGVLTYFQLCKNLKNELKNKKSKKWQQLFKWIIEESPQTDLFFLIEEMRQRLVNFISLKGNTDQLSELIKQNREAEQQSSSKISDVSSISTKQKTSKKSKKKKKLNDEFSDSKKQIISEREKKINQIKKYINQVIQQCHSFQTQTRKKISENLNKQISDPIQKLKQMPNLKDWAIFQNAYQTQRSYLDQSFMMQGTDLQFSFHHQPEVSQQKVQQFILNDHLQNYTSQESNKQENLQYVSLELPLTNQYNQNQREYINKQKYMEYYDDPQFEVLPPIVGIGFQYTYYSDDNDEKEKGYYSRNSNFRKDINTDLSMISTASNNLGKKQQNDLSFRDRDFEQEFQDNFDMSKISQESQQSKQSAYIPKEQQLNQNVNLPDQSDNQPKSRNSIKNQDNKSSNPKQQQQSISCSFQKQENSHFIQNQVKIQINLPGLNVDSPFNSNENSLSLEMEQNEEEQKKQDTSAHDFTKKNSSFSILLSLNQSANQSILEHEDSLYRQEKSKTQKEKGNKTQNKKKNKRKK